MPSKIILKKSSVASKVPVAGDLDFGELAINYTDSKLYFKKADGSIDAFTSSAAAAPVTSVGGYTGVVTATNLLDAIKTVDGSGSGLDADTLDGLSSASFYLASNPNGYTSNAGTVTSVGATSPLVSSLGTTPTISIPAATASANGYMTAAYASKLDGIAAGATNVTNTNQLTNGAGYITSAALASYLPLTGGTLTGNLYTPKVIINTNSDISWGGEYNSGKPTIAATTTAFYFYPQGNAASLALTIGSSSINSGVALQQGGNQVLHAGNYSSYALPLSGGTINSGGAYPLQLQTTQRYGLRVYNTSVAGSGWWLANDANTLAFHADGVGDRASLNSDGVFITTGSFRAPLFYDSNDTGYYIDPNSYSRIRQLTVTQTRVDSSKYPVGHYTSGQEVFSIDPTWSQDQLREYFNSNSISWVADSTAPGGYAISISGNVNVGGAMGSGFPFIPVETDDTFYMEVYVKDVSGTNTHYMGSIDFNESFGNLGGNPGSYGYWVMSNNGPGAGWTKYSGYISGFGTSTGSFKSGTKYWTPQALFNYTGGGTSYISGWRVYRLAKGIVGRFPNSTVNSGEAWFGRANDRARGTYTVQLGGGSSSGRTFEVVDYAWTDVLFSVNSANYASASGSFRAPIFYDSNDTGYYTDPNSTSVLNNLNVAGTIQSTNGAGAIRLYGNLHIDSYNGNDIYLNYYGARRTRAYVGTSEKFRVDTDGVVYAFDQFRSPIFYDNNDTTYYIDPAGNGTRAGVINGNLWINPKSESYGEGIVFNMPNQATWGGLRWYRNGAAGGYAGNWAFGYFGNESNNDIGFHNGTNGWRLDQSFNMTSNGSVRSPIFYDSNNTGYYTDPNGNSRLARLDTDELYNYGWFRNHNINTGLYNQATGTHFYSNGGASWGITGSGGNVELQFRSNHQSTIRGYVYGDTSNNFGFLDYNGSWRVRTSSGYQELYGTTYADDMRAYIVYDRSDTGYYCDPNSTSVLNYTLTRRLKFIGEGGDSGLGTESYAIYQSGGGWGWPYPDLRIAFHTGIQLGANASYQGIRFYTDYDMSSQVMSVNNGSDPLGGGNVYVNNSLQAGSSSRAPIFYDSNDTGYYVDPNGSSRINNITVGNGASAYLYMTDDESPGGSKSIHANSNYLGFLSGYGGWVFRCDNSGNTIAEGNVTAYSDERLKKNWIDLPTDFIENVAKVKNGTYERIDNGVRLAGSSAQDWLKLLPEVVNTTNDESKTLSLAYGNAALVTAIELSKRVVEQEARIKRLESLIEKLI